MNDPFFAYPLLFNLKVKDSLEYILFRIPTICMLCKFKNILISETNYNVLKRLGGTGESFNDVITEILKKTSKVPFRGESSEG